jgi:hypothetical protein
MFGVLEITMLACGYAMRANVRCGGRPGAPRILAWALCGLSAFMAIVLSGPLPGIARVTLGPVLAIVCLHMALGIEIRARIGQRGGTWAKIGRELRERALSRLGLANDERDAAVRTADRALHRAAKLATARRTPLRTQRLAKAVRMSGATTDTGRRRTLLGEVAALRHVSDLVTAECPSPWRHSTPAMSDTIMDNTAPDIAIPAGHTPRVSDTIMDIVTDTLPPRTTPNGSRHPATKRGSLRTSRGQDTRSRVARLAAKTPDITSAAVATQLGISERTALRHLTAIRAATEGA